MVPRPKTVEDVQELTLDELLIWLAAMYGDRLKKAGECLPGRRAMRRYSNAQSGSPRTNECGASLSPGAETFALPSLRSSSSTLSRPSRQPTDHQLTQLALSAQSPCSCGIRRSVVSRGDHLRGGGRQGIPRARSRGRGTPVLGRLPASRRSYCPPHTSPAPQVPGALGARSTGAPPVAAVAAWVSGRPPLSLRPPDVMGRGAAASPGRKRAVRASLSATARACTRGSARTLAGWSPIPTQYGWNLVKALNAIEVACCGARARRRRRRSLAQTSRSADLEADEQRRRSA